MRILREASFRNRGSQIVVNSSADHVSWSRHSEQFFLFYNRVRDVHQSGVTCNYRFAITLDEILHWIAVLVEAAKTDPALRRRLAREFGRIALKWFRFVGQK